ALGESSALAEDAAPLGRVRLRLREALQHRQPFLVSLGRIEQRLEPPRDGHLRGRPRLAVHHPLEELDGAVAVLEPSGADIARLYQQRVLTRSGAGRLRRRDERVRIAGMTALDAISERGQLLLRILGA